MDVLVIGNPENRRVTAFQESLTRAGHSQARVVSYLSLLRGEVSLESTTGTLIRIESPGENFEVEKYILELGGVSRAQDLPNDRGRIYYPGSWFKGFSLLMERIHHQASGARWFNHPQDIVTMFNKPLCKLTLAHCLPTLPTFTSFEAFFDYVQNQPQKRFFIKLNYSSSASGVLAYEYHQSRSRHRAYSTMEMVTGPEGSVGFYNSLKIKSYSEVEPIRCLLDFLFQAGALVEPWIPKAVHEGKSYDLRVLAIGRERRHTIARLSSSPMTNLHLGNQRCEVEELNLAQWDKIDGIVEDTMARFPRSLYAGLDILIPLGNRDPILLEVNAFGDLIPALSHRGQDTYDAEIEAILH